jgi:hypothetical protein
MRDETRYLTGVFVWLAMVFTTSGAFAQNTACGNPMTEGQRVQLALDIQAIQNVASRHEYYHSALMHKEEIEAIWAQKTPGVSWTNNTDRYVGMPSLKKFYVDGLPKEKAGVLWVHMLTTPVIEVAGDGKTAKGVWISFGHVSSPMEGKVSSSWAQEKYGMDFVKEDGKWKIWHLRTYVDFYSPIDESRTALAGYSPQDATIQQALGKLQAKTKKEPSVNSDMAQPDEKGMYYKEYSLTTVPVMQPTPPVPYCTFGETFSY